MNEGSFKIPFSFLLYVTVFFLRIHSLYILVNEGILENSCVVFGSKLFCSKFDQKSTPPSIEIFLVLCLFR